MAVTPSTSGVAGHATTADRRLTTPGRIAPASTWRAPSYAPIGATTSTPQPTDLAPTRARFAGNDPAALLSRPPAHAARHRVTR